MLKFLLIYLFLGIIIGIVFSYGVSLFERDGLKTCRLTLWIITIVNMFLWPGTVYYTIKGWKTFTSPTVDEMQQKFDHVDDMINGEGS